MPGENPGMRVLMVCLGNICRSPIAEAVLAAQVAARPDAARWSVDSAGTGAWHVGEAPNQRALAVLRRRGVATRHRARQVEAADFARFDRIFAMDGRNLADLEELRPRGAAARLGLLGEHDPLGVAEVPDPYYSEGTAAFEAVFDQVERCCRAFLAGVPPLTAG